MPPSYVDTATEQLQLEVESTALIRAAEEIMVLTRELKDLWLFGGLDTWDGGRTKKEEDGKMEDDVRVVKEAIWRYLSSQAEGNGDGGGGGSE
jgi:Surfeit locus protein 5 subunit 22 of Mediator complex